MEAWIFVLLLLTYIFVEFVNSVFFNWQLFLITEKKFYRAGIFGFFSTLIFLSSVVFSVYVSGNNSFGTGEPIWWFIPLSAVMMGIGNFLAAVMIPHLRKLIENIKRK